MFYFDQSSRLVTFVSAFGSSSFRFYISFRSFRPDFLSIVYDRGAVPLGKYVSMCMFSFQEAANCALCSILSASCNTFAVWMPKKMYRIYVNFVRALTRLRSQCSFCVPNEPSIAVALTLAGSFLTRSFPFFSSLNGLPLFSNDVCIPFSLSLTIGLTHDLTPSFGLILFLASPKLSAIAWSGSRFFILPTSHYSNVDL